MDVRFCEGRNHRREAHVRAVGSDRTEHCALLRSAPQENLFLLDEDLHGGRQTEVIARSGRPRLLPNCSLPTRGIPKPDSNYLALACSAWRVASRVLMSDSFGSFWMIGSMAHPSPNGTSCVSDMARHSTTTPALRSSNRQ